MALREYELRPGLYFYINDHLGTPQQLVTADGTTVWQAACLPFGEAQLRVGTVRNNLRFPGQYFDAETGLHYNWNRYYDPETGRYLSPDPIGLEGGMNLYAYANSNPTNYIDLTGLWFGIDDAFTGPVDEIIVLGGLSILAMAGNEWAKDALESLSDAISDALSGDPGHDECRDPCKGLRKQLKKHQDKLRQYIRDPSSMDNKDFLYNAPPDLRERIFTGRIKNLLGQIENFKRLLEECERKNGLK